MQCIAEHHACFREGWPRLDRLAHPLLGIGMAPERIKKLAEVVVRRRIGRFDGKRPLISRLRAGRVTARLESDTEIDMGAGKARRKARRLSIKRTCSREIPGSFGRVALGDEALGVALRRRA